MGQEEVRIGGTGMGQGVVDMGECDIGQGVVDIGECDIGQGVEGRSVGAVGEMKTWSVAGGKKCGPAREKRGAERVEGGWVRQRYERVQRGWSIA